MEKLAESIRQYARSSVIEPARRRGEKTVTVRVGDIHRAMGLLARVPAVCQALATRSFLESNHVVIEKREGPPSGLGTNVTFVYRLLDEGHLPAQQDKWERLFSLRGIGKDFYAQFGGGEKVIQEERDAFRDPDQARSGGQH